MSDMSVVRAKHDLLLHFPITTPSADAQILHTSRIKNNRFIKIHI